MQHYSFFISGRSIPEVVGLLGFEVQPGGVSTPVSSGDLTWHGMEFSPTYSSCIGLISSAFRLRNRSLSLKYGAGELVDVFVDFFRFFFGW